jgi:hypothetical protein
LFITALSLLLQISYLLYSAFSTNPSIPFAVTTYFLTELIPSICLFILFAPKRDEKRSGNSQKSFRSKINNDNVLKEIK